MLTQTRASTQPLMPTTRYTFHTSCKDPTAADLLKRRNGHPYFRESLELRTICFFPDHPVNTIPATIASGSTAVRQGVTKLLNAINYLPNWDVEGRAWAKSVVNGPDGTRKFVEHMAKNEVHTHTHTHTHTHARRFHGSMFNWLNKLLTL